MFVFIILARDVWNLNHIEKDCRRITFAVTLDVTPYAFERAIRYEYQLIAFISHLRVPKECLSHLITFVTVFGRWIGVDDFNVKAVSESAMLEANFPEMNRSTQTASILLSVSDD
jgi:hypothetical protein